MFMTIEGIFTVLKTAFNISLNAINNAKIQVGLTAKSV
jgi:hypothetical protein